MAVTLALFVSALLCSRTAIAAIPAVYPVMFSALPGGSIVIDGQCNVPQMDPNVPQMDPNVPVDPNSGGGIGVGEPGGGHGR